MFFFKKNENLYLKTGKFWISLKLINEQKVLCKLKLKDIKLIQKKNNIYFYSKNNNILFWKLFENFIESFLISWFYRFKLVGVGYKFEYNETNHSLNIFYGYSYTLTLKLPTTIKFLPLKERQVYGVSSTNKKNLVNFIEKLSKIRKFDPYKGKGLIFENKFYLRKVNKKNEN